MLQALIGPVTSLVGKFIKDKDQQARLSHDLATLASRHAQELAKGQIAANAEQAKHPSIFVAGARPAIMWICALGLGWSFFLQPLLHWILLITGSDYPMPDINTEGLISLTMALLGLSGMRSWEKSKGVARENMKK